MAKEIKYEAALAELQTIVRKMENDELDIDEMSVPKPTRKSRKSLPKSKFYAENVVQLTRNVYFCMQN